MPKNPPNLARLIQSADPADRVQVQQTDFAYDVMARYTCNDWAEVQAALTDGGFPFDAVVIGCGMLGGFIAEKLYHAGAGLGFRILVLEAGAFALPSHIQNLPQRLGGSIGGPAYTRKRDDASGTQNVVWGMPWISNEDFPGLAYCVGGRSLFWGGWTPRLLPDDLAAWPPEIAAYLDGPEGYALTEAEIGTVPVTDYMQKTTFHDELNQALVNAAGKLAPPLGAVEEAPLAVQGASPGSGLFAFDKFSAMPWIMDAVRDDVASGTSEGDVSRRIFVAPRTQVIGLDVAGGSVTGLELVTSGQRASLPISPGCAVVLAAGTIENTRLALASLGVGDTTFGSPRLGNLLTHLRSNVIVRIKRGALGVTVPPAPEFETTAFLVRGQAVGRRFHVQISAAAVGTTNPEVNMWEQVPDIDTLDHIRANPDPNWIAIVFRGVGEMVPAPVLAPDPAHSWVDLSGETDHFGARRAYVNLTATRDDLALWSAMDSAIFELAATLAGPDPADIQYLVQGKWAASPPVPDATGHIPWRDNLGWSHHEGGTLFAGAPGASITDTSGRFHTAANAYAAGAVLSPTMGSANPSLTALTMARRTAAAIVAARTLSPPSGFSPLSLSPADWQIVAAPGTSPAMRQLGPILETSGGYGLDWYIAQQFTNAAFWVEWRELAAGDNSGVYVRIPNPAIPDALHQADVQGHEIQIDDLGAGNPPGLDIHRTGAIYGLQGPTSFPAHPPGQWNSYLIETNGPNIRVELNGLPVNDYTSSRNTSGFLALQIHSGKIQFRNLQAKILP